MSDSAEQNYEPELLTGEKCNRPMGGLEFEKALASPPPVSSPSPPPSSPAEETPKLPPPSKAAASKSPQEQQSILKNLIGATLYDKLLEKGGIVLDRSGNVVEFRVYDLGELLDLKKERNLLTFDIIHLKLLSNLTVIVLANTGVTGDILHLKSLSNLTVTNLYNTGVTGDILHLKSLPNLTAFVLSNTGVTGDILHLKSLSNLKKIVLYNTGVTGDILHLKSLSNLTEIDVNNTGVTGDIKEPTEEEAWAMQKGRRVRGKMVQVWDRQQGRWRQAKLWEKGWMPWAPLEEAIRHRHRYCSDKTVEKAEIEAVKREVLSKVQNESMAVYQRIYSRYASIEEIFQDAGVPVEYFIRDPSPWNSEEYVREVLYRHRDGLVGLWKAALGKMDTLARHQKETTRHARMKQAFRAWQSPQASSGSATAAAATATSAEPTKRR